MTRVDRNGVVFVKFKHVGIPVVFLVLYLALAVLSSNLVGDAVLGALAVDAVMIAVGMVYYKKAVGDASLPLSPASVPLVLAALVGTWFVSTVTVVWLESSFPTIFPSPTEAVGDSSLYVVLSVLVAPVAEEVLFRGILFRHARQVMPVFAAYFVTNFVFALFHGTMIHMYGAVVAGILFTLVYHYTGMLSGAVAVHFGYNFLTVILSHVSLPDKVFSLWTVVPMNVIMLSLFIVAGVYIESTMDSRKGFRKNGGRAGARFVRQPLNVTAGMVAQALLPGCVVLVWDQSGTQLFNGTAEDLSANPSVSGRKVACSQSFLSCERRESGEMVPFLILKVL